jgi:hypothetical protein
MRRFTFLLSFLPVIVLGVAVAASRPVAVAQEATPPSMAATATHPVVGVWEFANDLGGGITFPSIGTFHADGTYLEVLPDGSLLVGVWRPTGERTADLTVYSHYVINDKLANGEGRSRVEVDATGNAITTSGPFVGRFEDGSIDIAVEGTTPGARLGVLPVVPLAQLVPGGTPVIPADLTGATPTP